jgi:hypothetical protein
LTVKAPVLVPTVVGLNLTLIVQLAPAATVEPQVVLLRKSALIVIPKMLRAVLP